MLESTYKECKSKMDGTLKKLLTELGSVRTGRASLNIFDGVNVDYYGSPTPLNQVAGMANPEPSLITIQPWEAKLIPEIEKAILAANLGLTPSSDGAIIRIVVPPLNEERRKEFVKLSHNYGEAAKTAIRNVRRDANEALKKLEKDKEISQDQMHDGLAEIQKITDSHTDKVDKMVKEKEDEILSF